MSEVLVTLKEKQKIVVPVLNDDESDTDNEEEEKEEEDEEEEEEEDQSGNEVGLGLSLEKLSLGPRKKLLVMSLGGVLVHRAFCRGYTSNPKQRRPDLIYGNHMVYCSPNSKGFMKFCLERYEVGIWSSAKEWNIDACLESAIGELRSKLLFIWDQERCTDTGFSSLEKNTKPLFLKETRKIWEDSKFGNRFSKSDTLLIDDSPYKAILNPAHTAIFPASYEADNDCDTELGPGGGLRKYLDGLTGAANVASYVKENPFGQEAITPKHSQWDFYSKILQRFDKKGSF